MRAPKLVRVRQPGSADQVREGGKRAVVELADPYRLVPDHDAALPPSVLRRHAAGTAIGVTGLRLDAAEGEHETAGRVAPVGPEREHARHVEASHDPSARPQPDLVPQPNTDQTIVGEDQPFPQRGADVVNKFERGRAGPAFRPVDHDKVGTNSGSQHRLADRHEFPWMADAELEAYRFAIGKLPQPGNETHQLDR